MENTVSTSIDALSVVAKQAAAEQGQRFARNKLERVSIASAAAEVLGTDPTFDQWDCYRINWIDGHTKQNPALTGNAHDAAWSEFAKLLDSLFGLTKPKSTSAAATKKAAEREQANEALLDKYQGTPAIELRDKLAKTYEAMAKNPENKELKKQQKELDKVLKLKTSEANKQHGETLKQLRTEVREMAGKCTDIEKLDAVLELLQDTTDMQYVIED